LSNYEKEKTKKESQKAGEAIAGIGCNRNRLQNIWLYYPMSRNN
jgi:hypothetical protein